MSIEKLIADNTAALQALTAALIANQGAQLQLNLAGQDKGTVLSAAATAKKSDTTAKTTSTATKASTPAKSAAASESQAAEKSASSAEETESTTEVEGWDGEEVAATPSTVTFDDVKDVTIALGKANKRDGLVKLLGRFNVTKASELSEDSYAAYHSAACLLLEA